MLQKQSASGEIPAMRWEPYSRRDSRNPKSLTRATPRGYFLDHLENFDAQFFGISPKEAEQMDPQQRLSLEVTWEALENAGIPPESLSGSDTSVFWGVNSDDYSKLILEDLPNIEPWMGIGTAYCGVPNRISYHLNLMGPSTAVDAACASSLVAIHHGRQAIIQGESRVSIVGGVNAMCGPGLTIVLDKAGATSSEGRCRSFDDSANGYGRGEGAAAIVLKRMADAIIDGDHILAVLKGSSVAQDGKTNGIMAPNAKAQQLVASNALKTAGIDPLTVNYVEAHATSTPLGDPTEVSAIAAVYGAERTSEEPCFIGSVKPNIGHLEAGAGAMGFIKAVLAVKKGILPPQANLTKLNSRVDWDKSGLRVVRETTKWPSIDGERRAGICSYGYGGTVSHAVIEQFSSGLELNAAVQPATGPFLLLLSGSQEKRLPVQAETLKNWIASDGRDLPLAQIANTLARRRAHLDYRAALLVDDHDDAIEALGDLISGTNRPFVAQSRVLGSDISRDTVWMFSGHGAQWMDMGKELLDDPAFYDAILPLDRIVREEAGFSSIEVLHSGDFEASDRVQILTYVMQIGISAALKARGVFPKAVIGHSVGEIAATVVSGGLTPAEGALIVTRRANLYREVMGLGTMILVNKSCADVEADLCERNDVCVAIDASPSSCVVSGTQDAVAGMADAFKKQGVKTFNVKTDIAFHSPLLNTLAKPLWDVLEGDLRPELPTTKLYTTSLQDPRSSHPRNSQYWINNMINPVRLTPTVQAALDDGYRLFLEVSSHALISHSVTETILDRGIEDCAVVPTVLRNKPAKKTILHSIGQLHAKGMRVNWRSQFPGPWASNLPTTTWIHKPVWRKIQTGEQVGRVTHDMDTHTLLGERISVAGTDTVLFTTKLDNDSKPFPGNHPLHGTEIVPAAGLVNTFLHATGANMLRNIVLRVPVVIGDPRSVQVVVQRDQVKITSRLIQNHGHADADTSWVTHTVGHWRQDDATTPPSRIDIDEVKSRIGTRLGDNFSIDYLDKVGVSAMGFPWKVTDHYGNTKEMIARVDAAPDVKEGEAMPWASNSWAPILDAATSVGSTIFFDRPRLRMPAQIEQVDIFTERDPPKLGWLYVQEASDASLASHVSVLGDNGDVLAKFTSMRFSEIEGTPGVSGSMESLVHQLAWVPAQPAEKPLQIDRIVFISSEQHTVSHYASTLPEKISSTQLSSAEEFKARSASLHLTNETAVIYVPEEVESIDDVSKKSEAFTSQLLVITKFIIENSISSKVYVITRRVWQAQTPTALAQAPLYGLSRVIASEHPDTFGSLIDLEGFQFPLPVLKYFQGADIVRLEDGIPRTGRLRTLPRERMLPVAQASNNLLPRPDGTYLITGGFGALGLAVADFLVEKGAQRLVLVSRRDFPPRREWKNAPKELEGIISRITELENQGASICILPLDIGSADSSQKLLDALENLPLPPVRGIVHAAGVLENQLVLETTETAFSKVLAPKIQGGLSLHEAFPPKSLDFFVLFSSCGNLFGFPGQSSYGSGNAFLDTLAQHRRQQGDNAVAFQWTSWRGMGMGASTDFINAELESKGITDVTRDEAFRAWLHLARYDIDHGVVLRSLALDEGEPPPVAILNDIAVRRSSAEKEENGAERSGLTANQDVPSSGPDLKAYLDVKIRDCAARVLQSDPEDIDSRAALSDLGVDSVMTVNLRQALQKMLKVKVPPTLTWSHPTVNHLVGWFAERLGS
ncbi:MAG: Type I Iterative PKS [Bathelium mastoideum]|nr:MAG: Type I Iterative PKS [Bathelium mastoideum]